MRVGCSHEWSEENFTCQKCGITKAMFLDGAAFRSDGIKKDLTNQKDKQIKREKIIDALKALEGVKKKLHEVLAFL